MTAAAEMTSRIRPLVGKYPGIVEKRIIGGTGFMLAGNLAVGTTSKGALLVRVDPARTDEALERGAEIMRMGTQVMTGFVFVDPAKLTDKALPDWVAYSLAYAQTLPPK